MLGSVGRLIAAFLFAAVATSVWAAPGKRVALVIGNAAYQFTGPLNNPANDAADMAAALKRLGFDVIEGRDLDESGMRRTIKRFAEALTGADVGLFFYAGHGLQVAGHNYLVPIDARLENAVGLDFELIRLDVVHRTMERETKANVIFLDACRDNPLSRNLARSMGTRSSQIGKGLAVVESGVGTLISFSTQPGNTALDGEGRNSPYAASLIRHITDPRDDLSTLLIQVRNEVMAATRDQQIPWEHSALRSKFYFAAAPREPPDASERAYQRRIELEYWASVKDSTNPEVLNTYLERYPKGEFAAIAKALSEQYERQLKFDQETREREPARRRDEDTTAAKPKRSEEPAGPEAGEAVAKVAGEPISKNREGDKPPAKLAALPKLEQPTLSQPFDGVWAIKWVPVPGTSCAFGRHTTAWRITNGIIHGDTKRGPLSGKVSGSGSLTATYPAGTDGAPVRVAGRLTGNTGAGTSARVDGYCKQTFTAERL